MSVHISLAKVHSLSSHKSECEKIHSPHGSGGNWKSGGYSTGSGENWGPLCNPSQWGVHNFRPAEPTSLFPFLSFSVSLFPFVCFRLHFLLWPVGSKHGRIQKKKGDNHSFVFLSKKISEKDFSEGGVCVPAWGKIKYLVDGLIL